MTILVTVPAGSIIVLTGLGGAGICCSCVTPLGGVPLLDNSVLRSTGAPCGWIVSWGRYEVRSPVNPETGVAVLLETACSAPDFFEYLGWYSEADPRADLTGTALPGTLGYGVPDGRLTSDDFFYFLDLCPHP